MRDLASDAVGLVTHVCAVDGDAFSSASDRLRLLADCFFLLVLEDIMVLYTFLVDQ